MSDAARDGAGARSIRSPRLGSSGKMPVVPEFVVLSRVDAEAYLPSGIEACVSITDPGQPPAKLSSRFAHLLRLTFSDVRSMRLVRDADVLFDRQHADAILDFIAQCRHVDRVVVHCEKGRSRSPAVAAALSEVLSEPVRELEARFPDWNRHVRGTLAEAAAARRK
jgi:predicted protein tyrosine phosphatase